MARTKPPLVAFLQQRLSQLKDGHEARHRPCGSDFTIAAHMADLNPARWDAIAANSSVLLQRPYLEALDRACPHGIELRFVIATDDGKPLAAMVFQLLEVGGKQLGAARLRGAKRLATQGLKARVLIAGNLLAWGQQALAIAPGADPERAWSALGEAMYRIRRSEELAGAPQIQLIKDLPDDTDFPRLKALGYKPISTEPDMCLALAPTWKRFDDYLAALAAKYRKQARDTIAAVDGAGLRLERNIDPQAHSAELYQLYLQVHARADVHPFTVSAEYLPAVAAALKSDFRCSIIRNETGIVGFISAFRDGDTAIGYHVGFDTQVNHAHPIYFRLLYHAVELAIELGCARLSLGRTALEPKAKLGARPVPLAVWARHRNATLNTLLKPLLGFIHCASAPERSPFKAAKAD